MKRLFDIIITVIFFILFLIPMIFIVVAIKITSPGPLFFWSDRIGQRNLVFKMPKFRTMLIETPLIATHLMQSPEKYLSPVGKILRRSSLDEIPQLWCVFKGDMSLIGPRPALFNQYDLINLRKTYAIDQILPGITGWAQVNGRDLNSFERKVSLDFYYLKNRSIFLDIKIIIKTFIVIFFRKDIKH